MLSRPDVKERFVNAGVEVFYGAPMQFDGYVRAELVKWTSLIREAGIEPE